MQTIRIGYQGDKGSNAEEAAKIFGNKLEGGSWIEYVPLVTAEGVLTALQRGDISLGVVAVVNSLGGVVSETQHMLDHAGIGDWRVASIDEHVLPIHHCLFTEKEGVDIRFVASHEQALKQTRAWRAEHLPEAKEVETIDTAYAARMLEEGAFAHDVAVICRKDVGMSYGLNLVEENIEDGVSYTTFHLLQGVLAKSDGEEPEVGVSAERTIADDADTLEVIQSVQD